MKNNPTPSFCECAIKDFETGKNVCLNCGKPIAPKGVVEEVLNSPAKKMLDRAFNQIKDNQELSSKVPYLPTQPIAKGEAETTSTKGEPMYIKAPPFYEPASAVSQSPIAKGEQVEAPPWSCKDGASHYCPNCDNSFDVSEIEAEARAEERERIVKLAERMKLTEQCNFEELGYHDKYCENCEHNKALSDLIAIIKAR